MRERKRVCTCSAVCDVAVARSVHVNFSLSERRLEAVTSELRVLVVSRELEMNCRVLTYMRRVVPMERGER